ncbi:hypothetical protein P171DRAFT_483942 [Karstenula rhodostoma CBS 690.94]|uniref:Uncharacterized protein n=1 Tax=Karstenula rhodostoma CBS 690.94 TaxID=1392251 RepID=A0A9P4PPG4_9PLEO|nr:hypothetical protein P171DRAFT_483942 [Karstenula rhodostoma CBS 690.94]
MLALLILLLLMVLMRYLAYVNRNVRRQRRQQYAHWGTTMAMLDDEEDHVWTNRFEEFSVWS